MQKEEYRNIYSQEQGHFFYIGNHYLIIRLVERFVGNRNNLQILDAGCGTGLLAKKLERYGHVIGVDISHEALKFSKRRGVRVIQSSITKLPFKPNTFDLIISVDVLYHQKVESDQNAIGEFKRVLKPGGILILKVPAYDWLRGSHDIVVETKKRYTTDQLKRLARLAGLKTLQASYFASFLLPLAIFKRILESTLGKQNIKSDVSKPPNFINSILISFYKLESFTLNFFNIPFGLSAFVIAQKSKQ